MFPNVLVLESGSSERAVLVFRGIEIHGLGKGRQAISSRDFTGLIHPGPASTWNWAKPEKKKK